MVASSCCGPRRWTASRRPSSAASEAGSSSARSPSSLSAWGWPACRATPRRSWVIGAFALAIAFASATQDIAIDAYAVEVLRREEQGIASGSADGVLPCRDARRGRRRRSPSRPRPRGRSSTCSSALLYLPFMVGELAGPGAGGPARPAAHACARRCGGRSWASSRQHRALEILAFVVLYKLSDNLTQALTRPFLVQAGFNDFDVGVATATIGQAAAILGTLVGGLLTDRDRPRPRAVDLRLSPDGRRTSATPPWPRWASTARSCTRRRPSSWARAGSAGGLRRAAAAAHAEALLRDAVRAALQPLHAAAHPVRARGRRAGGQPWAGATSSS